MNGFPTAESRRSTVRATAWIAAAALLSAKAMVIPPDHDEHQFIAAAVLPARRER